MPPWQSGFGSYLVNQGLPVILGFSNLLDETKNPNVRGIYEKSQQAEDFGCIKVNLFLKLVLAVTH